MYYIDHPDADRKEVRKVAGRIGHQISAILDNLSSDTIKTLEGNLSTYRVICGEEKIGHTEGFIRYYRNPLSDPRYSMERPVTDPPLDWGNPKAILRYLPPFLQYFVECRKKQVSNHHERPEDGCWHLLRCSMEHGKTVW